MQYLISKLPLYMKEKGVKNYSELSLLTGIDINKIIDFPFTASNKKKIDFKTTMQLGEFFGINESKLIDVQEKHHSYEGNLENKKDGIVYFLKFENGLTKIGYTKDIQTRQATLELQYNTKSELIGYIASSDCLTVERLFHTMFFDKWIEEELFNLDETEINLIRKFSNGEKRLPFNVGKKNDRA